jgi:hypothetical protein
MFESSHTNFKLKITKLCIIYCYYLLKIFGMAPFTYNRQQKQFETNALHTAYSIIFTLVFAFGFPLLYANLFEPYRKLFQSDMISVLSQNNGILLSVLYSYVLIYQIYYRRDSVDFLNESCLRLKSAVQKMPSMEIKFNAWFLFSLYLVFFPLFSCLSITISFSHTFGLTTYLAFLRAFFVFLPFYFQIIFAYPFTLGTIVLIYLYKILNAELSRLKDKLNSYQKLNWSYKYSKEIYEIHDELEIMAICCRTLNRVAQKLCELSGLQLFVLFSKNSGFVVAQVHFRKKFVYFAYSVLNFSLHRFLDCSK